MTLHAESKNDRLYALDALRAVMLLLGIVLHVAISYTVHGGWDFKDLEGSTRFADHAYSFIHYFRMPIFYILAGFFAALLFTRRGAFGLISNRLLRVGVPFILGLIILFPLVYLSFKFSIKSSSISLSNDTITSIKEAAGFVKRSTQLVDLFPPKNTTHLWFLYYLLYFYASILPIALLVKFIRKSWLNALRRLFQIVIKNPILRIVVLATITTYLLLPAGAGLLRTTTKFSLDKGMFFVYFMFFGFGWLLYYSREILHEFKRHAWLQTVAGFLLYLIISLWFWPNIYKGNLQLPISTFLASSIMSGTLMWLMFFGLTGLFLKYLDYHSRYIRYIVDASYWIYLIHLPITILIPGLMVATGLSVWPKMLIVFFGTCLIGLVTYDLFVRSTFIGKTLNGRRYKRGLPDRSSYQNVNG